MFKYFKIFSILFLFNLGCKENNCQSPNVVLIIVNDLNDYTEIFNGHPQAKTPNIKKLANSGVSFLKAYINDSVADKKLYNMISFFN